MEPQTNQVEEVAEVGPITFRLIEPGGIGGPILTFVGLGAVSAVTGYGAVLAEEGDKAVFLWLAGVIGLVAVLLPIWEVLRARRTGEIVIDSVRGVVRISRAYEIPFGHVRTIDVVEHEYTYRAINSSHDAVSAELRGWAIDIGGGRRLCGENGLSRERLVDIADALRVRVEAYRARTGQGADPYPRPGRGLLDRMAGALREEGKMFEENWLTLDGPMAEWMREYNNEPDERTMGRDGEFAQALRKAGFDLGEGATKAVSTSEEPR